MSDATVDVMYLGGSKHGLTASVPSDANGRPAELEEPDGARSAAVGLYVLVMDLIGDLVPDLDGRPVYRWHEWPRGPDRGRRRNT